jgi:large subunit ribosomal protein L6
VSRIGKKPIQIPTNVKINIIGNEIKVTGPKGELSLEFSPKVNIKQEDNQLIIMRPNDLKETRSLHGLTRALIQNMITGVTEGYKKILEIVGVGYKAELKGSNLLLSIGFSHPIYFIPPSKVKIEVPTPTQIIVSGIDKQLVGQVAAKIRSFRKPEPYKGKGIKYSTEEIRKKAGKTSGK